MILSCSPACSRQKENDEEVIWSGTVTRPETKALNIPEGTFTVLSKVHSTKPT